MATNVPKEHLFQLLNGVASPVNEHRIYAEQQLKLLSVHPGTLI
jgi:hypothetical protein